MELAQIRIIKEGEVPTRRVGMIVKGQFHHGGIITLRGQDKPTQIRFWMKPDESLKRRVSDKESKDGISWLHYKNSMRYYMVRDYNPEDGDRTIWVSTADSNDPKKKKYTLIFFEDTTGKAKDGPVLELIPFPHNIDDKPADKMKLWADYKRRYDETLIVAADGRHALLVIKAETDVEFKHRLGTVTIHSQINGSLTIDYSWMPRI